MVVRPTTHWRYAEALRALHPEVEVDHTSLYRAHGRLHTSAGSAAGIDLLIEIVRQDFGPDAANSVARRLVMPAHRTGGQAQFLERPVPTRRNPDVAPLLDRMRAELAASWTVPRMSSECRMSLRTFIRRFQPRQQAHRRATGWWRRRVEEAKRQLSAGRLSIDEIAGFVGMGTSDTLRQTTSKGGWASSRGSTGRASALHSRRECQDLLNAGWGGIRTFTLDDHLLKCIVPRMIPALRIAPSLDLPVGIEELRAEAAGEGFSFVDKARLRMALGHK